MGQGGEGNSMGDSYAEAMSSPDVTPILEELAAGRIDAAEASRRIAAAKAMRPAEQDPASMEVADADTEVAETDAGNTEAAAEEVVDAEIVDEQEASAPDQAEASTGPEPTGSDSSGAESTGRDRYARNRFARETFDVDPPSAPTSTANGHDGADAGAGQPASGTAEEPEPTEGQQQPEPARVDESEPGQDQSRPGPEPRRAADPGPEQRGGSARWVRPERLRDWSAFARETLTRDLFGREERGPTASAEQPRRSMEQPRQKIVVRSVGHRVRVVGDPRVQTVSVEGEHVLRRSPEAIEVITEEANRPFEGLSVLRLPRSLDDIRELGFGKELVVRVNPAMLVDVEVTAGSLRTEKVARLGHVRVTAGGARLVDVEQVDDALFQTGTATVIGTITQGRSRLRCESGNLTVRLGADSNVTVRAESNVGRVTWAGEHTGSGDEVIMGNGAACLDVGAVVGRAVVHIGSGTETDVEPDEPHGPQHEGPGEQNMGEQGPRP